MTSCKRQLLTMRGPTEGSSPNTSFTSRVHSSAACFVCDGVVSQGHRSGIRGVGIGVDSPRSSRVRRDGGGAPAVFGGVTDDGVWWSGGLLLQEGLSRASCTPDTTGFSLENRRRVRGERSWSFSEEATKDGYVNCSSLVTPA